MTQKNTVFNKMSKNDIVNYFLKLNQERFLVRRIVNQFKNNRQFSMIFNHDCVESEFNYTIALVLKKIDDYSKPLKSPFDKKTQLGLHNAYILGLKTPQINPYQIDESQDEMFEAFEIGREHQEIKNKIYRLDSIEGITGYFLGSFRKNISKIYRKHTRNKRLATDVIFLEDIFSKESSERNGYSYMKTKVTNQLKDEPQNKVEFKKMMVDIALHLRKVDKVRSKIQTEDSQLAKLFCSIVNEKKNMTPEELKDKFNWSSYLLNKNKEILINEVRKKFGDYQEEILDYLDERQLG